MSVLHDIMGERQRQLDKGFDADHDDQHADGSLAVCAEGILVRLPTSDKSLWTEYRVNRICATKTVRQQLVIAAALLVAEIERMDRAECKAEVCDPT